MNIVTVEGFRASPDQTAEKREYWGIWEQYGEGDDGGWYTEVSKIRTGFDVLVFGSLSLAIAHCTALRRRDGGNIRRYTVRSIDGWAGRLSPDEWTRE